MRAPRRQSSGVTPVSPGDVPLEPLSGSSVVPPPHHPSDLPPTSPTSTTAASALQHHPSRLGGAIGHAVHSAAHILSAPDANLHVSDSDSDNGSSYSQAPVRAWSRNLSRRSQRSLRTQPTNVPDPAARSTESSVPGVYVCQTDSTSDGEFLGPPHRRKHSHLDVESFPDTNTIDMSASTDALTDKTPRTEAGVEVMPPEQSEPPGTWRPQHSDGYHHVEQHADETKEQAYFDRAHSCKGKYVVEMGPDVPIRLAHLFKPPIIRQWVHGSHYFGEVNERQPSKTELFLDLVAVGFVHRMSDALAEAPAQAIQVALFAITFFLAWTLWLDQRMLINQSGSDDVFQRGYLVLMMILVNAFVSNASGIKIATLGESEGSEGESHESSAAAEAFRTLGRALVFRRKEGGEEELVPDLDAHLFGPYYFSEHWEPFLRGAMSFWLVARALKVAILTVYAIMLPNFRAALLLQVCVTIVCSICFLPLAFSSDPEVIMVLAVVGVLLDFFLRFGLAATQKGLYRLSKRRRAHHYFPAQSVEHTAERMVLFTVLVIGETIMNSAYTSIYPDGGHAGWDNTFGRSSLTIISSFLIAWVYFDADGSRTFVHALRRHFYHALQFTNVHAPLCGGVIVLSSVIPKLITNDKVDQGTLWYYSGGMAVVLLSIAAIACLHESLDLYGSAKFSTNSRILGRILAAILFFCLPIKSDWRTVHYLGVHTAILTVLVAFETMGKIGAVGRVYDEERSKALHRYQEAMDATRPTPRRQSPLPRTDTLASLSYSNMAQLGVEPKLPLTPPDGLWPRIQYYARKVRASIDKEYLSPGPSPRQPWHNYEDLSYNERGEEDVGNEVELGQVEPHKLRPSRRWALTAF